VRDPDNRRVEVFFFDGPITPPPPGKTSARGSTEYPRWLSQVGETVDFSADDPETTSLRLRFHDQAAKPLTNVPFRVVISGTPEVTGTSPDGFATVPMPAFCPASVTVEWGGPGPGGKLLFSRDIVVDCDEGAQKQQSISKLTNVGYPAETDDEFDAAARAFQADYNIAEEGLSGGQLPPSTRARLDGIYAAKLDASRPDPAAPGSDGAAAEDDGEPPAVTLSMECAL
jgi:hypothetical protein